MFGECENSAKEIPAKEAWNEAKICTYSSGGCGCRSGPDVGMDEVCDTVGDQNAYYSGTGKYRNRSNRYANASSDDGPGYWNFSYGQL